jgi:outer membrane protein
MKKIIIISILSLFVLSAKSQNKFGHINAQEILMSMPEAIKADAEIKEKDKTIKTALEGMLAEMQSIEANYKQNEATYNDAQKQDELAKYQAIADRIQLYERTAYADLEKLQAERLAPIEKKLQDAINEVAKEGGFIYIFADGFMHYKDPKNDIGPMVKQKLGL